MLSRQQNDPEFEWLDQTKGYLQREYKIIAKSRIEAADSSRFAATSTSVMGDSNNNSNNSNNSNSNTKTTVTTAANASHTRASNTSKSELAEEEEEEAEEEEGLPSRGVDREGASASASRARNRNKRSISIDIRGQGDTIKGVGEETSQTNPASKRRASSNISNSSNRSIIYHPSPDSLSHSDMDVAEKFDEAVLLSQVRELGSQPLVQATESMLSSVGTKSGHEAATSHSVSGTTVRATAASTDSRDSVHSRDFSGANAMTRESICSTGQGLEFAVKGSVGLAQQYPHHAAACLMAGHELMARNRPQQALKHYLTALQQDQKQPLPSLCIAHALSSLANIGPNSARADTYSKACAFLALYRECRVLNLGRHSKHHFRLESLESLESQVGAVEKENTILTPLFGTDMGDSDVDKVVQQKVLDISGLADAVQRELGTPPAHANTYASFSVDLSGRDGNIVSLPKVNSTLFGVVGLSDVSTGTSTGIFTDTSIGAEVTQLALLQETHYNIGRCLQDARLFPSAVEHYKAALQLAESHPEAFAYPVISNISDISDSSDRIDTGIHSDRREGGGASLHVTREAAHNLVGIYRGGDVRQQELAVAVMRRHLTF